MTKYTIPAGLALCPRCGGNPDMDDEGKYYTCYFCFDRGYVADHVAKAFEQDEADHCEQFLPERLGAPRMFSRLIAIPF
jgi:hypothetical protein